MQWEHPKLPWSSEWQFFAYCCLVSFIVISILCSCPKDYGSLMACLWVHDFLEFCFFFSLNPHIYMPYPLSRVFWLNIAKNEVYWCYKYCSKLFRKMRKEIGFRQQYCRNCKKKYNVSGERENWISVLRLPKFLSCPSSGECPKEKTIVTTKLLKL